MRTPREERCDRDSDGRGGGQWAIDTERGANGSYGHFAKAELFSQHSRSTSAPRRRTHTFGFVAVGKGRTSRTVGAGPTRTDPGVSMSRISFTTRRTVLGVPVGRRRTNWAGLRKAALAGAGAASTAAGGLRVARHGVPLVVRELPGQVADTAARARGQVRTATGQLAGVATRRLGQVTPEVATSGGDESRPEDAGRAAARGKEGRRRPARKRSDERSERSEPDQATRTTRTTRNAGGRRRQRSTST